MESLRVGWIGLGRMGRPMAERILRAGFPLGVWARRSESTAPFAMGAVIYPSPKELARESDVVFTMVSDRSDVVQVLLGPSGVVEGVKNRSLTVVDMSTISPAAARAIALTLGPTGVYILDAPVSGGVKGAEEGTLSIMIGGKAETLEQVRSLLEHLGTSIVHVGDHGAGQVAKACNQLAVSLGILNAAEVILLARRSGVDPAKVREALLGGFAGSRTLEVHGERMLTGDFRPGFTANLHLKDLLIVLEVARELGLKLPGAELVTSLIEKLVAKDGGDLDSSALFMVLEQMNT